MCNKIMYNHLIELKKHTLAGICLGMFSTISQAGEKLSKTLAKIEDLDTVAKFERIVDTMEEIATGFDNTLSESLAKSKKEVNESEEIPQVNIETNPNNETSQEEAKKATVQQNTTEKIEDQVKGVFFAT